LAAEVHLETYITIFKVLATYKKIITSNFIVSFIKSCKFGNIVVAKLKVNAFVVGNKHQAILPIKLK